MKGKKGFVLYVKHNPLFEALTDEQAGKLIKKVFAYCLDKNPKPVEDSTVEIAFLAIKGDLLEDLEKWKKKCEVNRENGQKGGRPKNQENENPKNPNGFNENPNEPKKPDKDKDKEKDKGKDKVGEIKSPKEKDKKEITAKAFVKPTLEEVEKHIKENNLLVDAQTFIAFYDSNGWKVGKNPMKSWKAALMTWHKKREEQRPQKIEGYNFEEGMI